MAHDAHNPLEHPEVQGASTGRFLGAFVLGLGLMLAALWMVVNNALPTTSMVATFSVMALVAGLGQFYLLFNLDFSEHRIWHTISLVMTIPLFILAIALTVWMFQALAVRTMLPGLGG